MFLRCTTRKKNGKEHRYWNLVENRRVAGGQVVQRQVLYLGEINDSQQEVWRKSIEVFEDGRSAPRTVALFAEDQRAPVDDEQVIQVRLKDLTVRHARQWGACWLACELYEQLKLDQFWAERLPPSRGVMDRGIPSEEVLAEMRASDPPIYYLVGTPKARLSKLEAELITRPWEQVRPGVEVKLLCQEGELYVQTQSQDRVGKERAIRKRRLRKLWDRLCELKKMKLSAKALLIKIGEAKKEAGRVFGLIDLKLPNPSKSKRQKSKTKVNFNFRINRAKSRDAYRREGRYLLRSNLPEQVPATLWEYYIQLIQVEEAFKNLKGDLGIRPIFHQLAHRIEAHIFIAFISYCLHVTLRRRLRDLAPGLTPRAVLEKFSAMQMIDVYLPISDGRTIILSRYTQPEAELQLLLNQLKLQLPDQPPPRITAAGHLAP